MTNSSIYSLQDLSSIYINEILEKAKEINEYSTYAYIISITQHVLLPKGSENSW